MPGKRFTYRLSASASAVLSLLIAPSVTTAAPLYECRATAEGWACTRDGVAMPMIKPKPKPVIVKSGKPAVTGDKVVDAAAPDAKPEGAATPEEQVVAVDPYIEEEPPEPVAVVDDGSHRPTLDENIDWANCKAVHEMPPRTVAENPENTYVYANSSKTDSETEITTFKGDVYIRQGEQVITGDYVVYDRSDSSMIGEGNVLVEDKGIRAQGDELEYQLDEKTGELTKVAYRVPGTRIRGTSDRTTFKPGSSNHEHVTYTTCSPGDNSWSFDTKDLEIDHEEGIARGTNAVLRVADIPVFYTPYIAFPIDDRRHSGFLVPSYGSSDKGGFTLSTPYYFNLAPNYDATFVPNYISDRGLQLGGEYRHLTSNSNWSISGDFLREDSKYTGSNSDRGQLHAKFNADWTPNWDTEVNLNVASDDTYISDVGKGLASTSTSMLTNNIKANYKNERTTLSVIAQDYQMLGSSAKPYKLLPQMRFDWESESNRLALKSDFTHFAKDNTVEGQRIHLRPSLSYPMQREWGYITPKLAGYLGGYNLSGQTAGTSKNPTLAVGSFSLDNKLIFERYTRIFDEDVLQTLEPRLYYLYNSYDDQSQNPNFDSGTPNLSFGGLFRENRFSGFDRVGDTSQVTAAVTTRFLSNEDGKELLTASIGQIYYLKDRKVSLSGNTVATRSVSPIIFDTIIRPTTELTANASIEWDPETNATEQGLLQANYNDGNNRVFNAAYRLNRDNNSTSDISASWPLSSEISAIGRWHYSFAEERNLETLAGLEYGKCCWRIRAVVQETATGSADEDNLSFYIQLQLDGLTQIGNPLRDVLEKSISGYEFNKDH